MIPEEKLLLACVKPEVAQKELELLLSQYLNWDLLLQYAEEQLITPLLYHHINSFPVPDRVLTILKARTKKVQTLNLLKYAALIKALKLLNPAGIKIILLKGIALANFVYPNEGIALRQMYDIDTLIPFKERTKLGKLFQAKGYKVYYERGEVLVFMPHVMFEFHNELDPWMMFDVPIEDFWRDARKVSLKGEETYILGPEDTLLSLILHRAYHHAMANVTLRDVADIEAICWYYPPAWDKFINRVKVWGVSSLVFTYFNYIKTFYKLSVPDEVLSGLELFLEPKSLKLFKGNTPEAWSFTQSKDWIVASRFLHWRTASKLKFKIKYLSQVLFPPLDHIAFKYDLPPRSWKAVMKYLARPGLLLFEYLVNSWKHLSKR
jgi:hypothetical protein